MTFPAGEDTKKVGNLIADAITAGARQQLTLQKVTVWLIGSVLAVNTCSMVIHAWLVSNQVMMLERQARAIPIVESTNLRIGDVYRGINALEQRAAEAMPLLERAASDKNR